MHGRKASSARRDVRKCVYTENSWLCVGSEGEEGLERERKRERERERERERKGEREREMRQRQRES